MTSLSARTADAGTMTQLHAERYRLVTRSDFDGLVCAALLKELDILDDIKFVHPKDMQDGKVELGPTDITTNLPYCPGVAPGVRPPLLRGRCASARRHDNHVIDPTPTPPRASSTSTSAAPTRFPRISEEMMEAVDKADAAQFSSEEILDPAGLGAAQLPDGPAHRPRPLPRLPHLELPADDAADRRLPRRRRSSEILALPDVAERVELYREHAEAARRSRSCAARRCTATSWCSTSATRRSSTRPTAS